MKFAVVKEVSVVRTPAKNIEMYRYVTRELSCSEYGNYDVGKTATVVKGKKIPKGTKVVIKRWVEDSYGRSYRSYFFNNLYNPAVLVELPDGSSTWTIAKNLELKPEDVTGYVATIEAESKEEADKIIRNNYTDNIGTVRYLDSNGDYKVATFGMLDGGISIYHFAGKDYIQDCGDCWACVLDDWRTDTYSFVVFTKEPALNNLVKIVDTGVRRKSDDMGGDTGIGDAIEAFEEYVSKIA